MDMAKYPLERSNLPRYARDFRLNACAMQYRRDSSNVIYSNFDVQNQT